MDTNKDMYVIVAEKEEKCSEIVLNVYDISGKKDASLVKHTSDLKTQQKREMLNEVYESLVTYEDKLCAKNEIEIEIKQEILDEEYETPVTCKTEPCEQTEQENEMPTSNYDCTVYYKNDECATNETDLLIKQEHDDAILIEVRESPVTYEDEGCIGIERSNKYAATRKEGVGRKRTALKVGLNIIKKEFVDSSHTSKNENNGLVATNDVNKNSKKEEQVKKFKKNGYLRISFKEEQLATKYWAELKKILNEEGIMVGNKKEISRECVKKLCDPANEKGIRIIKKIAKLMKLQVPVPEVDTSSYFINKNGFYQCRRCPLEKSSGTSIQEHYSATHGPRYLICLACDTPYGTKSYLRTHERNCASPLAPLVQAARQLEQRKAGPFPRSYTLACHVCGKMLRRSNMNNHLRTHASGNTFFCTLCTASFRTAEACTAHEHAHSGLRPWKCTQCPRAYTSRTSLQTHKQTHTELGFTCDVCGKCFNRKHTLIAHMATHSNEKSHTCKQCGKKLSTAQSLRNHMRKHQGASALYKCTSCNKRYPAIYTLRAHMKKKHGTNIVTKKIFFNSLSKMGPKYIFEEASDSSEVKNK